MQSDSTHICAEMTGIRLTNVISTQLAEVRREVSLLGYFHILDFALL